MWLDYDVAMQNDFTMWTVPGIHWQIGGAFVIAVGAAILGLIFFISCRIAQPAFFRKETLTRSTPTLMPDDVTAAARARRSAPAGAGALSAAAPRLDG